MEFSTFPNKEDEPNSKSPSPHQDDDTNRGRFRASMKQTKMRKSDKCHREKEKRERIAEQRVMFASLSEGESSLWVSPPGAQNKRTYVSVAFKLLSLAVPLSGSRHSTN